MCGWRMSQEDAEIVLSPYDTPDSALYAVFDGHGGDIVSKFAMHYFPQELKANVWYQQGEYEKALCATFIRIDDCLLSHVGRRIVFNNLRLKEQKRPYVFPPGVNFDEQVTLNPNDPIDRSIIREKEHESKYGKLPDYLNPLDDEEPKARKSNSIADILSKSSGNNLTDAGGCTANVGLIKDGYLYLANAGDSRSTALTKNGTTLELSVDHKPENRLEQERIEGAEGWVEDNRVNGNLALSRALGDFTYKCNRKYARERQQVIPHPECTKTPMKDVDFIVLACDGIWDCVTNEECTAWFRESLDELDSGKFSYTPKNLELEEEQEGKGVRTESTTDSSNSEGGYIDKLNSLSGMLDEDDNRNDSQISKPSIKKNATNNKTKDYKIAHVVEKFLDCIVADDTTTGKGTDNMTCILVRVKN